MFDIPLVEPLIGGNEWTYVKECLDTGWVSGGGKYGERFEHDLARITGVRHVVAVTSGTAALHLALVAAGVGDGDEVLVSDLTFIAPVNAIRYAGAEPVLVDVDAATWQMDVDLVESFLASCRREPDGAKTSGADTGAVRLVNPRSGRRVAAIIPVHILGGGVDIVRLVDVARRYSVHVIEDATECLGAGVDGAGNDAQDGTAGGEKATVKALGSFGDGGGCLSFNGNKTVTTGGGGAFITDDDARARKVRYLANQAKDDPKEFRHDEVGYNYRLSNVLAAIGCAQLERLDEILAKKKRIEARYRAGLAQLPGVGFMEQTRGVRSSSWLTTIRVDAARFGAGSRDVIAHLARNKIEARPLWTAIHENAPYRSAERVVRTAADVAGRLQRECVSLPSSFGLSDADQDRVIDVVTHAASK